MTFPRPDYAALDLYDPGRRPVEVDLSDNTNLWGTHPEALDAVRSATPDTLARYPSLYADELRAAVAEVFGVEPEQVGTGVGSDDVLDSMWRACAGPGGVVAWPAPTFSMMETFAGMNGRIGAPVRWSVAEADPLALFERDPVLVYLCRPNNPTGALLSRDWVGTVLDAADVRGTVVVIDEAYADFAGETLVREAVSRDRVIVARTLSKAFGLAGLRIGFAIGAAATIRESEKSRGPYKVGALDALAGAAALRDASGWAAARIADAVAARATLVDALIDRGFAPLPSASNFLFVPVPDGRGRALSEGLRSHEVSVRPFLDTPDWGDALRVTVGPAPAMERFLAAFDAVVSDLGIDPSSAPATRTETGR